MLSTKHAVLPKRTGSYHISLYFTFLTRRTREDLLTPSSWSSVMIPRSALAVEINVKAQSQSLYIVFVLKENRFIHSVHTWSFFNESPSRRRVSAGLISPSFMLIISPDTKINASCSCQCPSLRTCKCGSCSDLMYYGNDSVASAIQRRKTAANNTTHTWKREKKTAYMILVP